MTLLVVLLVVLGAVDLVLATRLRAQGKTRAASALTVGAVLLMVAALAAAVFSAWGTANDHREAPPATTAPAP